MSKRRFLIPVSTLFLLALVFLLALLAAGKPEHELQAVGDAIARKLRDAPLLDVTEARIAKLPPERGTATIRLSPDYRRYSYVVEKDRKKLVVIDGVAGPPYDSVGWFEFSPDSKRIAYAAKRGDKWFAVIDGIEGPQYDDLRLIAFSPDSKRVAYSAKRGDKWFAVIDGVEGSQYPDVFWTHFSPDSKHVSYLVRDMEGVGVFGDKFSWFLVLGGRRSKGYDECVDRPEFDGNGVLRTAFIRGAELLRVEVDLAKLP